MFSTVPATYAVVSWGKTILGRIAPRKPLVIARPRDSGPLDVVVRARGFLPVHTRAQTFDDCEVAVKLTRVEDKATLFGYREPLDAGVPDGSVVPVPGSALPASPAASPAQAAPNAPPQPPH